MSLKNLISKYQCPGCMHGLDTTNCDKCKLDDEGCINHAPGTMMVGSGDIYLGLPRAFNKVGDGKGKSRIRIWINGKCPKWDIFNIPVWYKMYEGDLLVKTVLPRRMEIYVDIIEGGKPDIIKVENSGSMVDLVNPVFSITPFDATPHEEID